MIQITKGMTYHCRAGETFDLVSLKIYGSEKYAPDLMNANPDHCGMNVFYGGEILKLPVLDLPADEGEAALNNTVAPWKQ